MKIYRLFLGKQFPLGHAIIILGGEAMWQLLAVLISFSLIPILIKRRVKLSYTLLITALVLGVLSNIGFKNIYEASVEVFIDPVSFGIILTIIMVSIIGGLMNYYNILGDIINTLGRVIRNKKNILMILPAFIGLLVIPGGALLSAPFINNLGKELELPSERRAVINLVFRHIAMFIMPYSAGLLIVVSSFPDLNIMKIISFNLVFVCIIIVSGYFLYIRDIQVDIQGEREDLGKNLLRLMILSSPIYIPVAINLVMGLAFYLALIFSVIIIYFLSDKKDFIENFFKSIDWHVVLTLVAILILKEIILRMDGLLIIFMNLFNNSGNVLSILSIFLSASLFFGFITGNQNVALAITLPMLAQLDVSNSMLYVYIYFLYGAGFIGYYFSPLHLCQAFTVEIMKTNTGALYKDYKIYGIILLIGLIGSFFMLRALFA